MSVFFTRRGKAPAALPDFADADWSTIIWACQENKVPDKWKVGDQKIMAINGVDYPIDIIGKNHDEYSDGSGKAPLTFQMHNLYGTRYAMNTSNSNGSGWSGCRMRSMYIPAILALMPNEIQAGIREVNKLTSAGYRSSTIRTTADKLFLLSEIEVFGSVTYSINGEGSQYAYYSAGNSTLKKTTGAVAWGWWLRSPHGNFDTSYLQVNGSNGGIGVQQASSNLDVAFAFCF